MSLWIKNMSRRISYQTLNMLNHIVVRGKAKSKRVRPALDAHGAVGDEGQQNTS